METNNMNTRARFEEIWPVPEGVYWSPVFGAYICADGSPRRLQCMELNLRLDTFTRCQETTDVYVSLVEELVRDLERAYGEYEDPTGCAAITRAKKLMEQKK